MPRMEASFCVRPDPYPGLVLEEHCRFRLPTWSRAIDAQARLPASWVCSGRAWEAPPLTARTPNRLSGLRSTRTLGFEASPQSSICRFLEYTPNPLLRPEIGFKSRATPRASTRLNIYK
jgi:hypothetical protein